MTVIKNKAITSNDVLAVTDCGFPNRKKKSEEVYISIFRIYASNKQGSTMNINKINELTKIKSNQFRTETNMGVPRTTLSKKKK